MHIDEYEEEKTQKINRQMDGSLKADEDDEKSAGQIATISTKSTFTSKSSAQGLNPVKEGLADTTLQIMKACLKNLRDKHISDISKIK